MHNNRNIILTICLVGISLLLPSVLHAWTGYDYDTGAYIEIDEDVSAIQGKDIEIYDYSDDSYHDVYVISVDNDGTVMEVYDHDTGDYRTFEAEVDDGQNYTEALWRVLLSNMKYSEVSVAC